MKFTAPPAPETRAVLGIGALFAGLWLRFDLGTALIALGSLFIAGTIAEKVRAGRRP